MSSVNLEPSGAVTPLSEAESAALIVRIRSGDATAQESFIRLVSPGIRFLLCRKVQLADVEQGLQNTLSIALEAIHSGEVSEPKPLIRFMLATLKQQRSTLSQRDTLALREREVNQGRSTEPESADQLLLQDIIRAMPDVQREVLRRYYLNGERPETIGRDLNLPLAEIKSMIEEIKTRFRTSKRGASAS